jgi:hypothetical protein
MRRTSVSLLLVAGLALVLAAAGCGRSSTVAGPQDTASAVAPAVAAATGAAVVQGTIVGGEFVASSFDDVVARSEDSGWTVRIEGTALATTVDEEGEFILTGVPAGTVILILEGPGQTARLSVSGLLDGQVLSLELYLSGGAVSITSQEPCAPSKDTKLTGVLDSMSGTALVIAGHAVDASQIRKVWRGPRRIQLENLRLGEKVKVWGALQGDGTIVAEEIQALTSGENKSWVTFRGAVQSLGFRALDLDAECETSYPRLVVAGRTVTTGSGTTFKWSDGSSLNPGDIKVGDTASVEGWMKHGGTVDASKVVIDRR